MSDMMGDRMKAYEGATATRLMPLLPTIARLDGKTFSSWTKGLDRPYDSFLSSLMIGVTAYLVEKTNALVGYTQSDEISLLYYSDVYGSQIFMDGKHSKMVSILSSMCTAYFNSVAEERWPEKEFALFDCRVWQVPNRAEATNTFLWRENDATKNSVQMAARCHYSHEELNGKGRADQMEMLYTKGVNWNNYPDFFKRGTWIRRKKVFNKFSPEELASLPEKHNARANPDLEIERAVVGMMEMPPFSRVCNREAVIFCGADPVAAEILQERATNG